MNKLYCHKQPDSRLTVSDKTEHIIVGEYYDFIEYKLGVHPFIDLINPNNPNNRILCFRKSDLSKWFLTHTEWRELRINQILSDD